MHNYFLALIIAGLVSLHVFNCLEAQIIESETMANAEEVRMAQNSTPEYLYKIVSKEQWQESLRSHEIVPSSLDEDFIHLAKEDQVMHVVQKFWKNTEYIVLKLASEELVGLLVYETNPGRTTEYYHLYDGKIPLEAIKDTVIVDL